MDLIADAAKECVRQKTRLIGPLLPVSESDDWEVCLESHVKRQGALDWRHLLPAHFSSGLVDADDAGNGGFANGRCRSARVDEEVTARTPDLTSGDRLFPRAVCPTVGGDHGPAIDPHENNARRGKKTGAGHHKSEDHKGTRKRATGQHTHILAVG